MVRVFALLLNLLRIETAEREKAEGEAGLLIAVAEIMAVGTVLMDIAIEAVEVDSSRHRCFSILDRQIFLYKIIYLVS